MTRYRRVLIGVLAGAMMLLAAGSAGAVTATSSVQCDSTATSKRLCTTPLGERQRIAGHLRYTVQTVPNPVGGTRKRVALKACDTSKDGMRIVARIFQNGRFVELVTDRDGVGDRDRVKDGCGIKDVVFTTGAVTV